MIIHRFESGPLLTNAYLVVDESTRTAVVIDAPHDCADEISAVVLRDDLKVDHVLLTHSHWDHTGDAAELRRRFQSPVHVHADDEYRMLRPELEIIRPPFPLAPLHADEFLKPDQLIAIGGLTLRVLWTPGHTEGSVCFYCANERVLFSGDTLFAGSVGRTDLPGGSWETLMHSLQNTIMSLADNVAVCPGHGETTTIQQEKMFNPFLNGAVGG